MHSNKKQNKAEKKNRRNKVERKFSNIQTAFDFFMNTCIKGPIKWKANKNEHGEGDNPHLKVCCKSKK